jgi:hypothetical protein
VLYPPQLLTVRGKVTWEEYTGDRKIHVVEPVKLESNRWLMMYGEEDFDRANQCLKMMKKASSSFGLQVNDPQFIEVKQDRIDS